MYLFKNETKRVIAAMAVVLPTLCFGQTFEIIEIDDVNNINFSNVEVVAVGSAKANLNVALEKPKAEINDTPQYECIYSYTINGLSVQENYSAILQIGETMTKFQDYATFAADSILLTDASDEEKNAMRNIERKAMFGLDFSIYQNLPADQMTVVQDVVPNRMSYTEPLNAFAWELQEETDTVCGYLCKKATATYGGKTWTTWYAEEIPVTAGPWKFNGLPGLILAAKDSEGLHEFRAIAFRKSTTPLAKYEDVSVFASTREKVVAAKIAAEKGGMKALDMSMIREVAVYKTDNSNGNIAFNGVLLRDRPNGYQALETE